jgi:hypothetical protein
VGTVAAEIVHVEGSQADSILSASRSMWNGSLNNGQRAYALWTIRRFLGSAPVAVEPRDATRSVRS